MLEASLEPFLLNSARNYSHCTAGASMSEHEGEDTTAIEEKVAKAGSIESKDRGEMHRVRQKAGKARSKASIAWAGFIPYAQRILRKGFWFRVHDDDTDVVAGRRTIPTSSERDAAAGGLLRGKSLSVISR